MKNVCMEGGHAWTQATTKNALAMTKQEIEDPPLCIR